MHNFRHPIFLPVLILLFIFTALPIFATTTITDRARNSLPEAGLNLDQYSFENVPSLAHGIGQNIYPLTFTDENGNLRSLGTGAVPSIASGIVFLASQPPVMAGDYIADVLYNTGFIVQPAYAQGLGFSSLTPILQIWKAFRNISYFLFILVFVVIGFMIMFRTQVDHQTVVSVQMALPKLILTLVLITFSYAIAGLVVDLLYLTIFVIIAVFHQSGLIQNPELVQNAILGRSIFRIGISYFLGAREAAGSAANAISAVIQGMVALPGGIFDWIVDSLAYLIIAIAILIAFFRTFFALLMAYIGIIMGTIFAPIQLLFNAIPGRDTFSGWIKNLIANAAIFPAVALIVIIGIYLIGGGNTVDMGITPSGQTAGVGRNEGSGLVPPMITSRGVLFDSNSQTEEFGVEHIRAILGLGIIMLLPEIGKIVKKALGVEDAGLGDMAVANLKAPFTLPEQFGRYMEGVKLASNFGVSTVKGVASAPKAMKSLYSTEKGRLSTLLGWIQRRTQNP